MPILATAVRVFIASSLVHMVFNWHNSDYRKVANEDEVMAALRSGKHLLQWFILCLLLATAFAAIALQTFGLATNPRAAGHLIGLISFLTFFTGSVMSAIWMGKPWGAVGKDLLDSLIYATVCALTFMWLWPSVA